MEKIKSKIKGALYGFAIGDAMGATTEFMSEYQIKQKYGEVRDIMGGGWLLLKPGDVTDDTQMTMCVCNAIEHFPGEKQVAQMLDKCCSNFTRWYKSGPKDIGNTCRTVITKSRMMVCHESWQEVALNPDSLGNGSLMRTMPIVLAGYPKEVAISQGRLTHNNIMCDTAIEIYYNNLEKILFFGKQRSFANELAEPTGHVLKTLNNALYWTQNSHTFEDAIINAVNHGGDADTIAAITGSLVGALYGYEEIPERWIEQLDVKVKNELDKYSEIFYEILKKVCTKYK